MSKKGYRQQLRESAAATAYYAAMKLTGAHYDDLLDKTGQKELPKVLTVPVQRGPIVNRTDEHDLEAAVMREVGHVLQVHPSIVFAVRQNTGMSWMSSKNGKDAPVWFYRWVKSAEKMTITDYWGMTRSGMFAIECKRRLWRYSGAGNEAHQMAFIKVIRSTGGRAGFATCAQDAINILEGK